MDEVVKRLGAWLQPELVRLPPTVRAVYVEYGEAYKPDMTKTADFDAFGFEHLVDGEFDSSNKSHVSTLGDFVWESERTCGFVAARFPKADWVALLKLAAGVPEVAMEICSLASVIRF